MNKREERKAETIEQILSVAEELIRETGYARASIQMIADRCGLSKGAMYHHFRSKEEVLDTISRNYYEQVTGQFLPIVERNDLSVREKMAIIMAAARQNLMNTAVSTFAEGHAEEGASLDNAVLEKVFDRYGERIYETIFAPLLEEGRESRFFDFPGSPLVMARYIHRLDTGLSRQLNGELSRLDPVEGERNLGDIIDGFSHALSRLLSLSREAVEEMTLAGEMKGQYISLLKGYLSRSREPSDGRDRR